MRLFGQFQTLLWWIEQINNAHNAANTNLWLTQSISAANKINAGILFPDFQREIGKIWVRARVRLKKSFRIAISQFSLEWEMFMCELFNGNQSGNRCSHSHTLQTHRQTNDNKSSTTQSVVVVFESNCRASLLSLGFFFFILLQLAISVPGLRSA